MEFKNAMLKVQYDDQLVGIRCVCLSEPDASDKVWIHLNPTPGIVSLQCLQEVSMGDLIVE